MNVPEISKIFGMISKELESGHHSEFFTDPRGGFSNTLSWAEAAITQENPDQETQEIVSVYIEKCRTILSCVQDSGWNMVTKRVAIEHSAKMANHKW